MVLWSNMINFLQSHRISVFKDTRKEIIQLIEDLEVDLAGNFEHDVIIEDEEIFHFSPENMKNLKAFHERVCYHNLSKAIRNLLLEII